MKNSEQQKSDSGPPAGNASHDQNPGHSPANSNSRIVYRRLRAPLQHGESLVIPSAIDSLWDENLRKRVALERGDSLLSGIIQDDRQEILQLAVNFSRRYRDVQIPAGADDGSTPFVMSGHQPALFHPGVWFKNFALSELAAKFRCIALNLIVDNDVCQSASIRVPSFGQQPAAFTGLAIDDPGEPIPFELRKIQNEQLFSQFADRAASSIAALVDAPLVRQLWKYVESSRDPEQRLGHSLAAGRHRLEQDCGLQTLELPVSELAATRSFARFAFSIIDNADRFVDVYNRALNEYRTVHKIRSRSHPVPALERRNDWIELPFWIWRTDHPFRKRLFIRRNENGIELSDLQNDAIQIDRNLFAEQFCGLSSQGIAIRPRALTLTMYSRLVLGNLFLHGIGGAKYDQLTDAIASQFFDIDPSGYLTVTATLKLPSRFQLSQPVDISTLDRTLREIEFHPETMLDAAGRKKAAEVIAIKQDWIARELPRGDRGERHRAVVAANQRMQPLLANRKQQLLERRIELAHEKRASRVLGSREFSFCLFPESLPAELAAMAEELGKKV